MVVHGVEVPDAECVLLGEFEPLTEALREGIPVVEDEVLTLGQRVAEGDAEAEALTVGQRETVAHSEADALAQKVAVPDVECVGDSDAVSESEEEPVTERVGVAQLDTEGEAEGRWSDGDTLAEPVGDGVVLTLPVTERLTEKLGVALGAPLPVRPAVPDTAPSVGDEVPECVPLPEPAGEVDALEVADPQKVVVSVALRDADTERVGDSDEEREREGVVQPLPEPLAATLPVARAEADVPAEALTQ